MNLPPEYAVLVVVGVFSAVVFLVSWVGDWQFRREMERLEQKEQSKRDERAKWQTPL